MQFITDATCLSACDERQHADNSLHNRRLLAKVNTPSFIFSEEQFFEEDFFHTGQSVPNPT